MSDQDHLLQQRLEKYKAEAVRECRARLTDAGSDAVLLEVEQMFDGRMLYFHFLGDVNATVDAIIADLTDVYQANVRSREFALLLDTGCGPDCGTPAAGPCNGGCAVCVVASACRNQPTN